MNGRLTIAHLSDLHLGQKHQYSLVAQDLNAALVTAGADYVIVTGDLTENGRKSELDEFYRIFGAWRNEGKLVVLPGNHDCLGDDIARELMHGPHADCVNLNGVAVIRVNTTRWHNRFTIASHGVIDRQVIDEVDSLISKVPDGDLVIVALHHHLVPLPVDYFFERLANWFHLPFAAELSLGKVFLNLLRGRCDLVMHGHRHVPWDILWQSQGRELRVFNAGCSTELGAFRLFTYENGALASSPAWVRINPASE